MSPIGSRIKLGVKVLLALIVAFVAWQFLQPDEDLHATIIVPSKLPAFGENDDVYAGLLGLEAPANSDFLAFGRAVREAMRRGEDILDAMERLSADREPLKPVFPPSMNCWLEPEMWLSGKAELGECGTFAEVEATLSQNAESIARYRAIQLLPTSVIGQWRAGATSIKLGKLLHLEIGKAIREGKREKALEIWRLHQVHQSRMVGSGDSWVAFAINLVNESMSQSALELLLDMDRRVARSESAVILAALGSGDLSRYDIAAQMRADYQLFERHALAEAGVGSGVLLAPCPKTLARLLSVAERCTRVN